MNHQWLDSARTALQPYIPTGNTPTQAVTEVVDNRPAKLDPKAHLREVTVGLDQTMVFARHFAREHVQLQEEVLTLRRWLALLTFGVCMAFPGVTVLLAVLMSIALVGR